LVKIIFMKHLLAVAAILTLSINLSAQSRPYNIVFDITTGDTATHTRVIRWSKGILESFPDAKIEIVFYGKALDMIVNGRSTVTNDVIKLATEKKVTFAVCEHAMQVFNIDKSQLLNGVITVPDALYELIIRQQEGYGYIKVVN
jgi:intracellular sulfur oxidation DsrE/DsrF family protein